MAKSAVEGMVAYRPLDRWPCCRYCGASVRISRARDAATGACSNTSSMELPRIASHTSISPTNIELLNYNHNTVSSSGSGDETELLLFKPIRTPASSRKPLSACITDYTSSGGSVTAPPPAAAAAAAATGGANSGGAPAGGSVVSFCNVPTFNIIPGVGAAFQPSRRREEACALQNLKRRVQQLRLIKANQQEPVECNINTRDRENNSQDLDNRPQLFQKIISNRPVSMVLDSAELRTAWQDSDFITDCLCWHNVYRQRHAAPPLTMSTQLCHYAQTWANHLAHTNTFYYRNDKDVGQNLFCRPSNALQTDVSGQEVASYWYMAVRQYEFSKEPDILHANVNAGHFTQLVWIKSRHFGVGKARSRSGKVIVVANYSPAGNISGHFQSNVLPPVPDYPSLPPPPSFRTFSSETTDTESTTSDSTSTR